MSAKMYRKRWKRAIRNTIEQVEIGLCVGEVGNRLVLVHIVKDCHMRRRTDGAVTLSCDSIVLPGQVSMNPAGVRRISSHGQLMVEQLALARVGLATRVRNNLYYVLDAVVDFVESRDDAVALKHVRVVGKILELSATLLERFGKLGKFLGSCGRHFGG
jgi:hypothetical protein